MNKNAIKKFAIEARKKLINSVTDKAGMLPGIPEYRSSHSPMEVPEQPATTACAMRMENIFPFWIPTTSLNRLC